MPKKSQQDRRDAKKRVNQSPPVPMGLSVALASMVWVSDSTVQSFEWWICLYLFYYHWSLFYFHPGLRAACWKQPIARTLRCVYSHGLEGRLWMGMGCSFSGHLEVFICPILNFWFRCVYSQQFEVRVWMDMVNSCLDLSFHFSNLESLIWPGSFSEGLPWCPRCLGGCVQWALGRPGCLCRLLWCDSSSCSCCTVAVVVVARDMSWTRHSSLCPFDQHRQWEP